MKKSFKTLGAILLAAAGTTSSSVYAETLKDMISPVTNPIVFEDPRQSTELRPLYYHHQFDDKFATEGGDVNLYALQARIKLMDNLSFIAVKDGYVDFNPKATLKNDTGFANLAAGFKYTLDECDNWISTVGLTYEAPTGEREVLQGQGDGYLNPFYSAGYTTGNWNFIGHSGFRIRMNGEDNAFFDANAHASYKIGNFYPLAEFGLQHVAAAGNRLPIADEGQDVINVGASNSAGENIVTGAVGARYRITDNIDVGTAYQFPLHSASGSYIIDHRINADMIYRF